MASVPRVEKSAALKTPLPRISNVPPRNARFRVMAPAWAKSSRAL